MNSRLLIFDIALGVLNSWKGILKAFLLPHSIVLGTKICLSS